MNMHVSCTCLLRVYEYVSIPFLTYMGDCLRQGLPFLPDINFMLGSLCFTFGRQPLQTSVPFLNLVSAMFCSGTSWYPSSYSLFKNHSSIDMLTINHKPMSLWFVWIPCVGVNHVASQPRSVARIDRNASAQDARAEAMARLRDPVFGFCNLGCKDFRTTWHHMARM